MISFFDSIFQAVGELPPAYRVGRSKAGRTLPAYRFGRGNLNISLIAGCHADEPAGPIFLKKLVRFLDRLPKDHELLQEFSWFVVPHANPDGEALNQRWYSETDRSFDPGRYLKWVVRELPGHDVEYGFPIEGKQGALRPENQFIFDFWKTAEGPFHLHASLHSMSVAFGAWFLIDPDWVDRSKPLQEQCRNAAVHLGYPLHDVDRQGEKGFFRIGEGFCTRPSSIHMKAFFLEKGDPPTASLFHPTSMESIRSLGGDCLTLVSEIPLFLIPRKTVDLSWPNPEYDHWLRQMGQWKMLLHERRVNEAGIGETARQQGLRPIPLIDQMYLQWRLITAGTGLVKQEPS